MPFSLLWLLNLTEYSQVINLLKPPHFEEKIDRSVMRISLYALTKVSKSKNFLKIKGDLYEYFLYQLDDNDASREKASCRACVKLL
ncbi:hypothetical protein C6Y03_13485 [Bacillus sp. LNXM65]|nr:hypothetical protein C6Y03_13485 [Bacillus sp. LNXM65]